MRRCGFIYLFLNIPRRRRRRRSPVLHYSAAAAAASYGPLTRRRTRVGTEHITRSREI